MSTGSHTSKGTWPRRRAPVNSAPEPGSNDKWVQDVVLFRRAERELAAIQPGVDLLALLKKRDIPLYVRLDRAEHVALVYREVEGLPTLRFDGAISYFRLSDEAIGDLQRADLATTCKEFHRGGLAAALGNESVRDGYWQVEFDTGYAISQVERRDIDAFRWRHWSKREEGKPTRAWPDVAVSYPVGRGNLYIEERDLIALRRGLAPDMMEFPPALGGVTAPIRLMYRAAYKLNARGASIVDVLAGLSRAEGTIFTGKRLDEAEKFIRLGVRRTAGGARGRPDKITLGALEPWRSSCANFLDQSFLSDGLRALIVASAWWSKYSAEDSGDFGPHTLKACLESMGLSGGEVSHFISIILDGVNWRNESFAVWFLNFVPQKALAQFP